MLLPRDSREGPLERANYEIMIIPAWSPFQLDDRSLLVVSPLARQRCQPFLFLLSAWFPPTLQKNPQVSGATGC